MQISENFIHTHLETGYIFSTLLGTKFYRRNFTRDNAIDMANFEIFKDVTHKLVEQHIRDMIVHGEIEAVISKKLDNLFLSNISPFFVDSPPLELFTECDPEDVCKDGCQYEVTYNTFNIK